MYIQDDTTYTKLHGDDSRAITDDVERTVHFNIEHFDKPVILHELVHCYIAEYQIDNVEFTKDQLEELCCTIIEAHYKDLDIKATIIYNYFKNYLSGRKKW